MPRTALAVATLFALAVDWAIAASSSAISHRWSIVLFFLSQSVILGQVASARALSTGGRFARAVTTASCFGLPSFVFLSWLYVRPERGAVTALSIATCAAIICAVIVLGLTTALAIKNFRQRPYIIVGWLWYLGTLVPVIGLVQVGDQAWADRYTYLPLIGLFVLLIWSACLAAGWLFHPLVGWLSYLPLFVGIPFGWYFAPPKSN